MVWTPNVSTHTSPNPSNVRTAHKGFVGLSSLLTQISPFPWQKNILPWQIPPSMGRQRFQVRLHTLMLCGWYLKTQQPGQFYLLVLCGPQTILETSATHSNVPVHAQQEQQKRSINLSKIPSPAGICKQGSHKWPSDGPVMHFSYTAQI